MGQKAVAMFYSHRFAKGTGNMPSLLFASLLAGKSELPPRSPRMDTSNTSTNAMPLGLTHS